MCFFTEGSIIIFIIIIINPWLALNIIIITGCGCISLRCQQWRIEGCALDVAEPADVFAGQPETHSAWSSQVTAFVSSGPVNTCK